MSGKLLMFAKLSLKGFIYSLVELFVYQVLTETDSTSIQFIFVSHLASPYPECNVRGLLFEFFSKTKIRQRFDKSDEVWRRFNVQTAQVSIF